jgi:hypothetical protein
MTGMSVDPTVVGALHQVVLDPFYKNDLCRPRREYIKEEIV